VAAVPAWRGLAWAGLLGACTLSPPVVVQAGDSGLSGAIRALGHKLRKRAEQNLTKFQREQVQNLLSGEE